MFPLAKCCKNCEYWVFDDYSRNHVCVNKASDSMANFTDAGDCCFDFEEKEKLTKDEILRLLVENAEETKRLMNKLKEVEQMDG